MSTKPPSKLFRELSLKKQLEKANPDLDLTPELEAKIQKLMEFFDQYGIDYSKFKPEQLSFISGKTAYPNYDQYLHIPGQHDMKKWLMAVKNIHYQKKAGLSFQDAVRQSTQDWKKMEIYDFLNWLRFYEEGTHMKYKYAQVWYENGQPGYFLHIKPDAPKEPERLSDGPTVDNARADAERNEEKRNIIEKQRAKIIGRLDSAEKLLRSPEGQQFAGDELEQLMEAIYTLKKKVQLVNKLSVSTRLYEDMIVREGNVLKRKGFTKAANMLYSVAQTPGQAGQDAKGTTAPGAVPLTPAPTDPSGAGNPGAPGGAPSTGPGATNQADGQNPNEQQPSAPALGVGPAAVPQETMPKGLSDFIAGVNDGNQTDHSKAADDELEVSDQEEELMVTEAQALPAAPPGPPPEVLEDVPMTDEPPPERGNPANLPPPATPAGVEPLEVTEDDIGKETADISRLDSKLDATFESVTMSEIVAELEDISRYYKVREMPRRLARIDMMFHSKGISAYFPALAEAQNKALEANNYIATRIDDMLTKVRGSMSSENMVGKLKQDEVKEKQRKQMRKDQEAAELEGPKKETPKVEMEELAPPPAAPAPVPAPPAAAPARGPAPIR